MIRSAAGVSAPSSLGRLLLLCVLVGAIAGLGAIAFYWLLEASSHVFLDGLAGYRPQGPAGEPPLLAETATPLRRWVLLLVPALGGLLSGVLVYRLAPEAAGHGTDAAIDAYHNHGGRVRGRVPVVKAIASAITIGSGGSGGREGPIAQIGSGFGALVANRLGLSNRERRTLMAAGMAAGIGAIFHAPLAGALFAAEVLYREMDLEHEVLVPAFIASIVAYSIFAVKFGWSAVFATPDFVFQDPLQLLPYAALAVVVAAGAAVYVKVFYGVHRAFERLAMPRFLKPALGGLLVGVVGWFVPGALATGYGVLQGALHMRGDITLSLLLTVAVAKILTTALSIGSGGSGGVFGPAIVIGGALGGCVGLAVAGWFPAIGIDPGAFVLVGMAGFFAAAANCPISTLIMVSEMTGNYHLLVPSMLVCVLAYLLARPWTLYEKQLMSRLESPSKMGHMLGAVLRQLTVRDALAEDSGDLVTFAESLTLDRMLAIYSNAEQTLFPVTDGSGRVTGVVRGRDIRRAIGEEEAAELVVARDLARPAVVVGSDDPLLDAFRRMKLADVDRLLVVDATGPPRILEHRSILRAYDRTMVSSRRDEGLDGDAS